MRAIRVHKFGGPEVLQLDEVTDPKPGPGQVLVRVRAAGVNQTAGDGVARFKKGDRVYVVRPTTPMSGAYAELALCDESMVHPLPTNVSFSQGAALSVPYGTAYRGLHHK